MGMISCERVPAEQQTTGQTHHIKIQHRGLARISHQEIG
jgi:hypothetical protein